MIDADYGEVPLRRFNPQGDDPVELKNTIAALKLREQELLDTIADLSRDVERLTAKAQARR